jgi:hypothetical protein
MGDLGGNDEMGVEIVGVITSIKEIRSSWERPSNFLVDKLVVPSL